MGSYAGQWTGLPVGSYTGTITITATSPNAQNAVQTVLITLGVEQCTLSYEFNCDCDVDVGDIMQVASRWRCRSGDGCYKECYYIDKDGDVDEFDLGFLLANWQIGTLWEEGNFDGDLDVDEFDLGLLLSNWTVTPEPATLGLLLLGGLALVRRRRPG